MHCLLPYVSFLSIRSGHGWYCKGHAESLNHFRAIAAQSCVNDHMRWLICFDALSVCLTHCAQI